MAENAGDYTDRWYEADDSREMVKSSVNDFKGGAEKAVEKAVEVFGGAPKEGGLPGQGAPLGVKFSEFDPKGNKPKGLAWTAQKLPPLKFAAGSGGSQIPTNPEGALTTTFNIEGFSLGQGSDLEEYDKPTDLEDKHEYAATSLFSDISAAWDLTNYRPAVNSKPTLTFGTAPTVTVPTIGVAPTVDAPDAVVLTPHTPDTSIAIAARQQPALDTDPVLGAPLTLGAVNAGASNVVVSEAVTPNALADTPLTTGTVTDPWDLGTITEPGMLSTGNLPALGGVAFKPITTTIDPATLPALPETFDYTSERYQPQYLAAVVAKAQEMMAGAMLVPAYVWNALWSRAHGRLARQAHGALLEADTEFASRGWGRPGGSLNAARARIRSEIMGKGQDINLEKAIQQATQVREDAIKGMDTLATIDAVLETFHAHHHDRLLRSAVEAGNRSISVYNAALQAYQITKLATAGVELQIAELEMKQALAELDVQKLQLEGVKTLTEIDRNRIQFFATRWDAAKTRFETILGRARLVSDEARDANKDQLALTQIRLDAEKLRVDAGMNSARLVSEDRRALDQFQMNLRAQNIDLAKADADVRLNSYRLLSEDAGRRNQTALALFEQLVARDKATASLRIEIEKLLSDDIRKADTNKIAKYAEEWKGEIAEVEAYKAWVESVKANVEAQRNAVAAFGENAKAQQTIMQSWVSEWDAYVKYLEGTKTKAGLAETRSNHFARRVGFFQAADQAEAHRFEADVTRLHKIPLDQSNLLLAQRETAIKEMLGRLEATVKPFMAQYQALGTLNQAEAARVGSLNQIYDTEIKRAAMDLQAAIETVKEALGYWQTYQQAYTGWQSAYAGVIGQLGSAFASAANISLGASSGIDFSANQSSTFTRSHGYDVNISVPVDSVSGGLDLNPPL